MTVLSRRLLDGRGQTCYLRNVDSPYTPQTDPPATESTPGRKRRSPPSLPEQANRTNRIRPWADTWKALKAGGRWR